MGASPLVMKINQATKESWPQVSAGIAQTHQSMLQLAALAEDVIPRVEEYVANGPTGSLRRRKVCEETIWVLARMGWLRTGGERDAILAAKAYVDGVEAHDVSDDELVQLEDQLLDTIQSLPEYMTTPRITEPQEA